MPAKSQAQARFIGAVASGNLKKKGLSKEKAREFLRGVNVKKLPETADNKKDMKRKSLRNIINKKY